MENSFQQFKIRAADAILARDYGLAIEIYTTIIASCQGSSNNNELSKMFAARAGCYDFATKFEESLKDSETAISHDRSNISAHIGKVRALVNLKRLEQAKEAIHVAYNIAGPNERLDEMEKTILNACFTLGMTCHSSNK